MLKKKNTKTPAEIKQSTGSSPEELSRLIKIVDAKGLVSVLAGLALILGVALWSLFGTAPSMVLGQGILSPPEGLMNIVSLGQGQVEEINILPGETVHAGEEVGRITLTDLVNKRETLRASLDNARKWTAERSAYYEKTLADTEKNNVNRIKYLKFQEKYLQEYSVFLKEFLEGMENVDKDFIIKKDVEDTRKNLNTVMGQANDSRLQVAEIEASLIKLKADAELDLLQSRRSEEEIELELENLEREVQAYSKIVSAYDGVVVDVEVEKGDYLSPGSVIASMKPAKADLEAVLLFQAAHGKKIKPGMIAYVYPSTADKEEYGCIYGVVDSVTEFPVSSESLMKTIGSKQVVATHMEQGVLILARISLLRDTKTFTGFKWSSSQGPEDSHIEEGTVCTGNVVLSRSRPIDLVFPKLSKMLGLRPRPTPKKVD